MCFLIVRKSPRRSRVFEQLAFFQRQHYHYPGPELEQVSSINPVSSLLHSISNVKLITASWAVTSSVSRPVIRPLHLLTTARTSTTRKAVSSTCLPHTLPTYSLPVKATTRSHLVATQSSLQPLHAPPTQAPSCMQLSVSLPSATMRPQLMPHLNISSPPARPPCRLQPVPRPPTPPPHPPHLQQAKGHPVPLPLPNLELDFSRWLPVSLRLHSRVWLCCRDSLHHPGLSPSAMRATTQYGPSTLVIR